ncbi:MAG: pyridoxamine 5'-phosphate oxidase family protein [Acidimicrobiales bacterium]
MASWAEFSTDAPDLAQRVGARFTFTKHHVMATLRRDGSPRVSGTEVDVSGREMYLGSMPGAAKALDLLADPRVAIHSNPGEPTMDGGDAKVSGRAIEVTDPEEIASFADEAGPPPGPFHLFRVDLGSVTLTSLHPDGDRLVIETWHPGRGITRVERT